MPKPKMLPELPFPIITEILTKLPAKSILRFRAVSKQWLSLLDTKHFITTHLKNSMQNLTNHVLLVHSSQLLYVDYPSLTQATILNNPLTCARRAIDVLGSCNGLLCLSNYEEEGEVVIYNPATRACKYVPVLSIDYPDHGDGVIIWDDCLTALTYGFGYDPTCEDYKLVRISLFRRDNVNPTFHDSEVIVYSVKLNAWRKVEGFPGEYNFKYKRAHGEYFNGCLHWVVTKVTGSSDEPDSIIAFDVRSERFKFVAQPRGLSRGGPGITKVHINVGVLKECLSLLCNYAFVRSEVWIMGRYGVRESWSKAFTVAQPSLADFFGYVEQPGDVGYFDYVRPIVYPKGGSKVLIEKDGKKLYWYDVKRGRAEGVEVRGMPGKIHCKLMVESLVSLDFNNKKKKKPKKKRNEQSGQLSSPLAMLPVALLCEIFLRLPADTLWQLKLVCKAWNNTIDAPDFAKVHLEVYVKKTGNLNFILREQKLYLVDCHLNKAFQIDHPLKCPEEGTDVVGSCDGLILLYNEDKDIAIWNPLTGRSHKVSLTKSQCPKNYQYFIHGFGYDSISDDYKVIRVRQLHGYPGHEMLNDDYFDPCSETDDFIASEVEVYSLRAKHWRKIECFPYILCYSCAGVLASGSLHWVARQRNEWDSSSYIIVAFDLGSEKCRELAQPDYGDRNFHMSLWLFNGSLCLLCHYPKRGVEVWVMKDYEMQSWCKLMSITQPKPIESFEYMKPWAYSRNKSEVLLELDYEKFAWYNLQKKSIRHVNLSSLPKSFDSELYFISLLDPCNIYGNSQRNLMLAQKKQQGQSTISLATFQKNLLFHILSRLPAKTLLQVKRVCKTWYNIITDPGFITRHLELSSKLGSNLSLILGGEKILSVEFEHLDKGTEINHPVFSSEGSTYVVGSCNGLVCLYKDGYIGLWNPMTAEYNRLPQPKFQFHASKVSYHCFVHGFGYDPISGDYKVVCILQLQRSLRGGSVYSEFQTYSFRAQSWGMIHHFPYVVSSCSGILASGTVHWVAHPNPELYSSSNLLIAFDLGAEKCSVVTQPNYIDTDFHMSLGLVRDRLCFLCHYPNQSVDFWVMTDPGTETWIKLVSISQPKIIRRFDYLKPLALSEDGSEILVEQDNEKLFWYNMEKKTVRYIKHHCLPKCFETVMCSGSLVRIGDGTRKCFELHEQAPKGVQSSKAPERDNMDGFLAKGFKLKL